jgi:importin subunit beta-1
LREGILEAHTGIITGFKKTDRGVSLFSHVHLFLYRGIYIPAFVAQLLVPHAPAILELVQKVLADDNSGEPLDKLAFGVIGDLGDTFPNGEIKQLLLSEWIASSLVSRKGYDKETKITIKWAREVRCFVFSRSVRSSSIVIRSPGRCSSARRREAKHFPPCTNFPLLSSLL